MYLRFRLFPVFALAIVSCSSVVSCSGDSSVNPSEDGSVIQDSRANFKEETYSAPVREASISVDSGQDGSGLSDSAFDSKSQESEDADPVADSGPVDASEDADSQDDADVVNLCGNDFLDTNEECDDGNTTTEACAYGLTDCTVCNASCQLAPGATSYCGDGIRNANEQCDDGNTETEACEYNEEYCTVCASDCTEVVGATSLCGDGVINDDYEQCDDENAVTEACDYGQTSCTVCGSTCQQQSGITSRCGDELIDAGHEECDDGNDDPYDGCDACTVVAIPSCGDGMIEPGVGEECDDGNENNHDGCNAACKLEAGWTCPQADEPCFEICGDNQVVGAESCDDGNQVTETCVYGQTSCTVCNASCQLAPGATSYCGDNRVADGESCDDGNRVTETCDYGETSCTVCNASCREVSGATSYCGDLVVDSDAAEECDSGAATETCTSECKFQRYCVARYSLVGTYQVTGAIAGNGTWDQAGGEVVVRLPDDGTGHPGDGPASYLYYSMPTSFQTSALGTTVTTNVVTTAGTSDNECPLATGTLSGTDIVFEAPCPYGPNHCSNDWIPDNQNPPSITLTIGCLPVTATGNIECDGLFCGLAGLSKGSNPVDDSWYQPQNTIQHNADFSISTVNGEGGPTDCGGNQPNALEVPVQADSRGWVTSTGTRVSMECGLLPADCP